MHGIPKKVPKFTVKLRPDIFAKLLEGYTSEDIPHIMTAAKVDAKVGKASSGLSSYRPWPRSRKCWIV